MAFSAPVSVREKVIELAISKLGVHEDPPNSNKVEFSKWYGVIGPWCAMFVSWCFYTAGLPLKITTDKGYSYCPYGVDFFKRQGRWADKTVRPQRGWVVFFDFIGRPSHTGIVEGVAPDGRIICLEGNTNPAGGRTGGEVMRHYRSASQGGIIGYGIIDWNGEAPRTPIPTGGSDRLVSGQRLDTNGQLVSAGGRYRLAAQADGNLVVYDGTRPVWSTSTNGMGAARLEMQTDGNVVLYSGSKVLWASGTNGTGANVLVIQEDGNLVLYAGSRAVWDSKGLSGSNHPTPAQIRPTIKRGAKGDDVEHLQRRLTAHGFNTVVDGSFGTGTEKQVKAFQAKQGWAKKDQDGIVGPKTWAALG